jgi:hypothetical protein
MGSCAQDELKAVNCRIDVLAIEPVHGRGRWVAQAFVRVVLADVPIILQGSAVCARATR